MAQKNNLNLIGVRQHNLKNLNLSIEHDEFVAITGVSGSGKSSLAFDTIYAEGATRYIETFSPYTRQFLDRLPRPQLDVITGVRPALALEQRNRVSSSRSTVGTVTEINDYLKIIWSHFGAITCTTCKKPVSNDTPTSIMTSIIDEICNSWQDGKIGTLALAFPVQLSRGASVEALRDTLQAEGFVRFFRVETNEILKLEQLSENDIAHVKKDSVLELLVVVDRLKLSASKKSEKKEFSKSIRTRLLESIKQAYKFGHGDLTAVLQCKNDCREQVRCFAFSQKLICPDCGISYGKLKPSQFSFNSPLGACDECNGFGQILTVAPDLCVPDDSKSIEQGAVACWNTNATRREFTNLKKYCRDIDIDVDIPWRKIPKKKRELVFSSTKKQHGFDGVVAWFGKLQRKTYKMHVRVFISRYRTQVLCPKCDGSRLKASALSYNVIGKTISDIWQMPVAQALSFFEQLFGEHREEEIAQLTVAEVISRLSYLVNIGLDYLTLDRQTRSLSGGECQRVNLCALLGSRLVNTSIVLDEPSIGLHRRDTHRLISIIEELRDRGNSVMVVEHDDDIIRAADKIIDMGPGAGSDGGCVVYQGEYKNLEDCKESLTAKHLFSSSLPDELRLRANKSKPSANNSIVIFGASANNLKSIDVELPLEKFVVVTGVSGSGKSTLIENCLVEPYLKIKQGRTAKQVYATSASCVSKIKGFDLIDDIISINQSVVGKTPRSNPATYTKAWDIIRECFADTNEAQALGLSKSAFSFNVEGGRCPECKGAGANRVEMQFLADVFVQCEACGGSRFQESVLNIAYAGKTISDILHMTLGEVVCFFSKIAEDKRTQEITKRLQPLFDLGLGYLQLGQPLSELSGGESQRVKLASYLKSSPGKRLLFILDEPTTGLHSHDISKLLKSLRLLMSYGHSVVCIEHSMDVIRSADWIVDLGPVGGEGGGRVVARGTPAQFVKNKTFRKVSYTAQALLETSGSRPGCSSHNKERRGNNVISATSRFKRRDVDSIGVINARHHNLKDVTVFIPKDKLSVITGVSGSGKSTLAFDILFAEGQRRYIDSLSPYARQYITQLERPDVGLVTAVPPTIAISQKTAPPLGISTISTTIELYQFLRLLYAKVGTQHCPEHKIPVEEFSSESITSEIIESSKGKRLFLFAPVVSGRKGHYGELINRALKAEITEAVVDGEIVSLHPDLRLERNKLHWISLLVASFSCNKRNDELLRNAVEQCLLLANGVLEVACGDKFASREVYSVRKNCPKCKKGFHALDPQDFSFRSKRGVCEKCQGKGGTCSECSGSRIGAIGRNVFIHGYAINELTALTAPKLLRVIDTFRFSRNLKPIVEPILAELKNRLSMIVKLGLDYLQLDRESSTLSGGEAQRLRFSRALGSPLTGVCYVLDEPTIGLHPSDHSRLMSTLFALRDSGNTIVVVEHDEETIRSADYVIDIGPEGGARGGKLVVAGEVADVENSQLSRTGAALRRRANSGDIERRGSLRRGKSEFLEIKGVSVNNLRAVDAKFLIGGFTVVAGVSGAGKSSLVHAALVPGLSAVLSKRSSKRKSVKKMPWGELSNYECFKRVVEINQTPVGRTSTSTPASFLKIFDEIRKAFALEPEALVRGWTASHFSFNNSEGRCKECSGKGVIVIPMSFLPEARSLCSECGGMRYDESIMEVAYQGISIGELLQKTMDEARKIFRNHVKIRRALDYVSSLGLGYLTLGQPTYTLSGGEAQRLKIARELGSRDAVDTLYIMDEPTTGLHMTDVDKLLNVTADLVARGNSVVVIEHDLDVVSRADHLIELGPGPGEKGGRVVFSGTPERLIKGRKVTATKSFLKNHRKPFSATPQHHPLESLDSTVVVGG